MTAEQVSAKWTARANAATQEWVDGINSVTVSPGQLAAAQDQAYLAGVQQGVAKWKAKLGNMSAASWKAETVAKGQSRYGQGVTAGQAKYNAAIAKVLAAEKAIVGSLPPRGNIDQNIARSGAFQRAMHQAAQTGALSA